jgi:ComF family protein
LAAFFDVSGKEKWGIMRYMTFLSQLTDILYPPRCHLCGRFLYPAEEPVQPKHVCANCRATLAPVTHPLCTVCGISFPASTGQDHLCENCLRTNPWYDLVRAPYLYSGPIVEAVQKFKYKSQTFLIATLGPLLSSFAREWITFSPESLTVPVPLHRQRLRERGFNQSLLLARAVSSELGTRLDYLSLIRNRYTSTQTGLSKEARKKNVKGAFSVVNPESIKGETILLVDDVFTTGHTLNECARTLKRSGAQTVICLTLARVSID